MLLQLRVIIYFIFFFFQAEDGIRDLTVTGVQTCALPIFTVQITFNPEGVAKVAVAERGETSHSSFVDHPSSIILCRAPRSEERRVGKECRSRWSPYH